MSWQADIKRLHEKSSSLGVDLTEFEDELRNDEGWYTESNIQEFIECQNLQLAKQQEEIERLNIDMQSLINLGHKANSRLRDDAIRQQEELDEPVYGISMFSCGCLEEVGSQLTKKQAEEWCKELNQSNDDYLDKSFFVTYDYHLAKHNKGE